MPATEAELFALLDRLGIVTTTHRHAPVFTVEQARRERGELPGAHTKNLFLKDKKGRLFLLVALEDRAVELKSLHHTLGCGRLSFGSAALLRETLGVEPGSVTPLAVINDAARHVTVALDAALMAAEILNVHPLANSATSAIRPGDLARFLAATGHPPLLVELESPRPACWTLPPSGTI
jgi:Ala-tRNA(Pro) deacylase